MHNAQSNNVSSHNYKWFHEIHPIMQATFPEPTALLVAASEGGLVMAGAIVVVVVVAGGKLLATDDTTGGTPED